MPTLRFDETCSCGATVKIDGSEIYAKYAAIEWRDHHEACAGFGGIVSTRILKHHIPVDNQAHMIGEGAHVRHVGEQDGQVTIWATHDDAPAWGETWVQVCATGQVLPSSWVYVGTVQMTNGLVWHVGLMPGGER